MEYILKLFGDKNKSLKTNKIMKELLLSVMTKLLASTLLVFWMLMTLILSVSLIGILVVIEEEWSGMGIKLTNSLSK